jgi:hypothetical protein
LAQSITLGLCLGLGFDFGFVFGFDQYQLCRHQKVELFPNNVFSAIDCPLPPDPPANGGRAIVRNSGIYFGKICAGTSGYEALPGEGCSSNSVMISKKTQTIENKTFYDILVTIPSTANPGSVVFRLDFCQPVSTANVSITGSVIDFSCLILF